MLTDRGRLSGFLALAALACLAFGAPALAQDAEGSFERTLQVSGPVDLNIRSGSGQIRVMPGAPGQVRIAAKIQASRSWFSGDVSEQVRQVEKNPPVEQAGNSIRVGFVNDNRLFRNISIHYDVTVPAHTTVKASTGSGAVDVGDLQGALEATSGSGSIVLGRIDGTVSATTGSGSIDVRGARSLNARSGSGSIKALGIGGDVTAQSGSGGVEIEHAGQGSLDVSSSSGDVRVTGVEGAARVSASSGSVLVEGRPTAPWNVHSASGSVTLRIPRDAAFDLDARAGSGSVESALPITVSAEANRRHMRGQVRGGGALVEVRTASGGITIQ